MVASWSMFTQNIRIFDPVGCHFKGGKVMNIKKSSLIYSASHTRALTLISMSSHDVRYATLLFGTAKCKPQQSV